MKRDCTCPRARHKHGTLKAYTQDGCRCERCSAARSRHAARWRYGYILKERAGVPVGLTDGTGTRRRMRALTAIGWSGTALAAELGVNHQRVAEITYRHDGRVQRDLAARVADLYDRLWDKPQTGRGATRAKRRAEALGWPVPLAWDDDEIDNPDATAHTADDDPVIDHVLVDRIIAGTTKLPKGSRAPERAVAVRRLAAYGLTDAEIARRVGITQWNCQKVRERNGIEPARPSGRAA